MLTGGEPGPGDSAASLRACALALGVLACRHSRGRALAGHLGVPGEPSAHSRAGAGTERRRRHVALSPTPGVARGPESLAGAASRQSARTAVVLVSRGLVAPWPISTGGSPRVGQARRLRSHAPPVVLSSGRPSIGRKAEKRSSRCQAPPRAPHFDEGRVGASKSYGSPLNPIHVWAAVVSRMTRTPARADGHRRVSTPRKAPRIRQGLPPDEDRARLSAGLFRQRRG